MHSPATNILLLLSTTLIASAYQDDVRFTELAEKLTLRSETVPTGAGVAVTQVEASASGTADNYVPDGANSEFTGKAITDQTGGGGNSSHATTVGVNLFGNETSIAPGINTIDVYFADDWLYSRGWFTGFTTPSEDNRLQNHSWIGTTTSSAASLRMDFAVVNERNDAEDDGFLPIAGLNNGNTTTVPAIYGSMYNGITVGRSNGGHSQGGTVYDTAGRLKPEIVAPSGLTSYATPMVTATAALLIENAGTDTAAKDQLTLKAILLAGADKSAFASWSQSSTQPIDAIYGAGQLDAYESYFIQEGGQQAVDSTIGAYGWNLSTIAPGTDHDYNISVPPGFTLRNLSALITWNRIVTKSGRNYSAANLPDLELSLSDNSDPNNLTTLQSSNSSIDNLEHIWRDASNALPEGDYTLTVRTDSSADYALAWRSQLYQDYTLWKAAAFTAATPVAEQDADDDPEGDGVINQLEQAFGGDPEATDDTSILPQFEIATDQGNDYLQISFRRPDFENGLTYTVETVNNLNDTWSSATADVEIISINDESDGYQRHTYRCVEPITANDQGYLRVVVSQ
ncbi:MAG: hypothetical protein AAGC73_04290 [Verrucomicrobiota bacterium]